MAQPSTPPHSLSVTSPDDCITSAEWLAEIRALLATDGLSDQLRQDTLRLWYNRLCLMTIVPDTPAAAAEDPAEVAPGPTRTVHARRQNTPPWLSNLSIWKNCCA